MVKDLGERINFKAATALSDELSDVFDRVSNEVN